MRQLLQPLFGDLILKGVGLTCMLFVLALVWDACRQKLRARAMRVVARRTPDSNPRLNTGVSGQRQAHREPFRIFNGRLVFLALASICAVMLTREGIGKFNPQVPAKTSPASPAPTDIPTRASAVTKNWSGHKILESDPAVAAASASSGNSLVDGADLNLWEAGRSLDSPAHVSVPLVAPSLGSVSTPAGPAEANDLVATFGQKPRSFEGY